MWDTLPEDKSSSAKTKTDIDEDSDEMDALDTDSGSSKNDDAEYSEDDDSGNGVCHEVPGLGMVARIGAAWFQKNWEWFLIARIWRR